MSYDDESNLFAAEEGCSIHPEAPLRECTMCGAEFCAVCSNGGRLCPDCYSAGGDEDDDDDAPDFEDVENLDALLEKDDEVEKLLAESEDIDIEEEAFDDEDDDD